VNTFTGPRIVVPIRDQLTNAVRGVLNSVGCQLNSVLQSVSDKLTDALALAIMDSSESRASGLLSRLPSTASNSVAQACLALVSRKDAAGNPLSGAM
jgi:hypothetical protein